MKLKLFKDTKIFELELNEFWDTTKDKLDNQYSTDVNELCRRHIGSWWKTYKKVIFDNKIALLYSDTSLLEVININLSSWVQEQKDNNSIIIGNNIINIYNLITQALVIEKITSTDIIDLANYDKLLEGWWLTIDNEGIVHMTKDEEQIQNWISMERFKDIAFELVSQETRR